MFKRIFLYGIYTNFSFQKAYFIHQLFFFFIIEKVEHIQYVLNEYKMYLVIYL